MIVTGMRSLYEEEESFFLVFIAPNDSKSKVEQGNALI